MIGMLSGQTGVWQTPHAIFHGVLLNGIRPVEKPKLQLKDVLKGDVRDFDIPTDTWIQAATYMAQNGELTFKKEGLKINSKAQGTQTLIFSFLE